MKQFALLTVMTASLAFLVLSATAESKFILEPRHNNVSATRDQLQAAGARVLATYGSAHAVTISDAAREGFLHRTTVAGFDARELEDYIDTPKKRIDSRGRVRALLSQGPGLFILQFVAPLTPEWATIVNDAGLEGVESLHERAMIVVGTDAQVESIASHDWIQYAGPYLPEHKFAPFAPGQGEYVVMIADTSVTAGAIDDIERRIGGFLTRSSYHRMLTARFRSSFGLANSLLNERTCLASRRSFRRSPPMNGKHLHSRAQPQLLEETT
ncbi:MAG: hypothetical protein ABI779_12120 [Acidobacteriota bacterium]